MTETVLVPGGRDVRATLDTAGETDACVVACPPHPQHRGHRSDARLEAVSDALTPAVDCLRIDYGAWDEGRGERTDVIRSVAWARDRYERVGVFGFSFGGTLALLVASEETSDADTADATDTSAATDATAAADTADETDAVDAVAALAPTARLTASLDAVAALDRLRCPARIVYGTRDDTADWRPVIERAEQLGTTGRPIETVELAADHFFVGQQGKVADSVGPWLVEQLRG